MCDDILKNMINVFDLQDVSKYQDELRNSLLYKLEKLFVAASSSLLASRSLREELDYDVDKLKHKHLLLINQLNREKKYVYQTVIETIHNNRSGLFFVHGHGGIGKIFLWITMIAKIRFQNQIVLAVASSGIASLLIPGGRMAHSRFKIPINITDCLVCEIKKGTHLAKLITEVVLILWDEAPMNHKQYFETLDRSLRDVIKRSKPSDFRKIIPIVPNGSVADVVEASLTSSYLWPYLTIFFLKQNMRLSKTGLDKRERQELANFGKWILDIGNGTIVRTSSKVVPHPTAVELNRKTTIVPIDKTNQEIPKYDDPFMVPSALNKLVSETKRFQLYFENQNNDFWKTNFIIYGLLQDQLPSNPAIASIDPQMPSTTPGKQSMREVTPAPVTPSQQPDQQPQSVAPAKTSKRAKKTRNGQTETTNSARIAREFHKLVVPKIESTDKESIAALNTKSQAKKRNQRWVNYNLFFACTPA
ncbi:hypothetical protein D8674_028455 [Pyrus ussuriensis x Pyrus communis]|uniref:ATP-dependent DNA helicase n=1 Tax=Pyrus ussuriensis x Pyrus communis TaxID=2448454 RepID=A0A5N5HXB7_9ROSA|nr:hypothetical protein D8674_028455 [Pyrus ussuriensis x Pyrus communis]